MRKTLYFLLFPFLMFHNTGTTQNADARLPIESFAYVAPATGTTNFHGTTHTLPEFSKRVFNSVVPSGNGGNILNLAEDLNASTGNDYLKSSGIFGYTETAVNDEGESKPAKPVAVDSARGNPYILVFPFSLEEKLAPGETSTQWFSIFNFGDGDLNYNISISDQKNHQSRNSVIRNSDPQKNKLLNTNDDLDDYNFINNVTHPIVGGAIDPFYGTSPSHEAFENLPAGSDVIVVNESSMGLSGSTLWLSTDPFIGTLEPFGAVDIQVNFDATDLSDGVYTASINIASNDPSQPLVVVPVTLTVASYPEISVSPDSLQEELEQEHTSTQYLTINNTGEGVLNWNILQSQTKTIVKEKYSNGVNSFTNNASEYIKNGMQRNSPTPEKPIQEDGDIAFQMEIKHNFSGTHIDFDDTAAPCLFIETQALSNEYLSSGITFIGNGNDGGAVLNECSNFGVVGHSSPNFFAFNINSTYGNGGIPQGPQTILFTNPVSYVELYAGLMNSGEINITAFDSNDNMIAFSSLTGSNVLQPMAVSKQGIKKVVVSFTGNSLIIDDLFFSTDYYTGWLLNAPTSGIIPPGSFETIAVTFDATGLTPDVYNANINISSNDPDEPLLVVPVTLTVLENALFGADFMAEPLSGTVPLMVQFTDLSNGNVLQWEWDFDNNGSVDSYEQNPVWTYISAGVYSAKLTVYDDSKGSDFELKTNYITVYPDITYFEPVWTSPFNPMKIHVVEALLDSIDLQPLSQIGVFDTDPNNGEEICVGAMILKSVVSPGNYPEIITSMNDETIPGHANGFTPGHPFIFKYMTTTGQLVEQVSFTFPYPGYDEVFTSLGSAIVKLSGVGLQPQQHPLSLNSGWTGISSYLIPQNTNIQNVLADIGDNLIMLKNLNEFYQPGNPTSSIQQWDYQSGYFIKVNDETTLTIDGAFPANSSVSLTTGWNLIPVLSDCDVSIIALFDGQIDKLECIKEAVGFGVYWPSKTISTLTLLTPGHSYLVKVTENIQVTFPECE